MLDQSTINKINKQVDKAIAENFRPGFKFVGSMNFADLLYVRDTVEWTLAERFYYNYIRAYYVTINCDGYIVKLERES